MALKDWKKIIEGEDITFIKGRNKIEIYSQMYEMRKLWTIRFSWRRREIGTMNKSQALKFAKAYMRKH